MPLTLKAISAELAKRGHTARLKKGSGYFHFGESADWLDRTVRVPALSRFTLKQWLEEFHRLKKVNQEPYKRASSVLRKKISS
jgi:hypothetical protein